ncbi:helix-turn-helix domain-containing protein [Acetobacter sacchari]|uniref:Helix-turn-helix domain-containing protein n=1 Tax=Acetobacter sacchari TaxID=2661687 RepID=A0ABS3M1H7_9PROT|nr:helix-turn-helix domain-containing protein [Acetobacter sacchari]MBO1361990.1 helix-turn-helix domain-containing protein [Acetobacter sacchari]
MSAPDVTSPICLSTEDAARRIGISGPTLRRMTRDGDAPPSIIVGRKRRLYPEESLREWVRDRTNKERAL